MVLIFTLEYHINNFILLLSYISPAITSAQLSYDTQTCIVYTGEHLLVSLASYVTMWLVYADEGPYVGSYRIGENLR